MLSEKKYDLERISSFPLIIAHLLLSLRHSSTR